MLLGTSKPNKLSYTSFNFWINQSEYNNLPQKGYKNRYEWVGMMIHRTVQMIKT